MPFRITQRSLLSKVEQSLERPDTHFYNNDKVKMITKALSSSFWKAHIVLYEIAFAKKAFYKTKVFI